MSLKNDAAVSAFMDRVSTEVINGVSDDIRKHLQINIEKHTYLDGTIYERTGEFIESFNWHKIEKAIYGVVREFSYRGVNTYSPDAWQHGSVFGGDARANLADILNVEGLTSSHWIARKVKPYWKITIKELLDGGKIEKWITKELKLAGSKYGFKVIQI